MNRNARIGLFVIVAVVIFGYLSYKMGTFDFGRKTYLLEIEFESVGGLAVGSPVRMAGVNIGTVKSINLIREPDGASHALVRTEIIWDAIVSREAIAAVQMVGFLGDSVLEIAATGGEPVRKDEKKELIDRIKGEPPFEMQKLVRRLEEGMDQLTPVIEGANAIIGSATTKEAIESILISFRQVGEALSGPDQDRFNRIFAKLESTVDHFQVTASSTVQIATDVRVILADNREMVRASIAEIRELVSNLKGHEQDIAPRLILAASRAADAMENVTYSANRLEALIARNEQNVSGLLTEASGTAHVARQVSVDVATIVRDMKEGKGTMGRLFRDEELADEIEGGVRDARKMLSKFKSPMESLNVVYQMRYYGDDRPWVDEDNDNRLRVDLALRMPLREPYFIQVGADDIGADTGLDLQFGGNWGRFTGRLGVIESEAALGADFVLWPKHLTLSTDYVGISDDEEERLNSYFSVHLPWRFDLQVGVEDLLDEKILNAGFRKTF